MPLPGDLVITRGLAQDPPRIRAGLLVTRMPLHELYEDDDHDVCSVLLLGQTRFTRYQGATVTQHAMCRRHQAANS